MEEIVEKLKSLDNVQLRAELLKHGEKVGPVTPTTRTLFMSRLAKKLYAAEHPGSQDQEMVNNSSDMKESKTRDSEPDSLASTPAGRKGLLRASVEKDADMYYVVILADTSASEHGTVSEPRVFTEKPDALTFMKKNTGSRLKVFQNGADVKSFMTLHEGQAQVISSKIEGGKAAGNNSLALEAEKSAFKGPKIQELVQFRRLVEKGDTAYVKATVWANPRYLITGADTPVILHEGMRHNALHIAAKANQASVARLVLDTVLDPDFTTLLYSTARDTQQSRFRRILYLSDLYLNSPDKGAAETPLHIACKMGHSAVVETLVMFSATDRTRINIYGEKPEDIICTRYKGDNAARIKEEIQEFLKGLCLVPLLRSVDNITLPVVGEPCSPDDKKIQLLPSAATPTLPRPPLSPKEPRLTLSAYAGPMSPSKARDFQKQWMNPRYSKNSNDVKEFTIARRTDAEKGYERIGRKLARELHVPWTEYWQFLDAFADFTTQDGLRLLEQYLSRQQLQMAVLRAMEDRASSDEDSASGSSSQASSGEDSQEDCFFSCDEDASGDQELRHNCNMSNSGGEEVANGDKGEDDEGDDSDVFEDSLDHFYDTQSYIFGQRLQLKLPLNNNTQGDDDMSGDGAQACSESTAKAPTEQKKQSSDSSDLWSYREAACCRGDVEEKRASETSYASNTSTQSFDASKPALAEENIDENKEKMPAAPKTPSDGADKSFNTVMSELSEELESKLIFSPEGKVVPSTRRTRLPDVGLCLEKSLARTLSHVRGQHCPLDVLIKSRRGSCRFLADVLVHTALAASAGWDDSFSDDSFDGDLPDVSPSSKQKFLTNVKVVARNAVVSQYVRRLSHPGRLTVGLLYPGERDVAQHHGCVTARIVRRKPSKCAQAACYIYGRTASKTDLDVMRAMCDIDVDPAQFPAVHSWLSLVTSTEQEHRKSWPSPAKVRHQQRLSVLHRSSPCGSPIPISPLVEGGTITSTPVSCSSHQSLRASLTQDHSSDPSLAQGMPRAWLFKSPT